MSECWKWLHEIDKVGDVANLYCSGASPITGSWENVDMELSLNIKLTGEAKRRVAEMEAQFNRDNELPMLLNGRMNIWILDDFFKIQVSDRKQINMRSS